jgi:hypothetical protein
MRIWNSVVKSNLDYTFDEWVARIGIPMMWGSTAELMLFAACLQIHVVSVELLRDTVGSVATQHTFAQCRVRPNNTSDPNFYTMAPGTAKNVIYLWNHYYKNPLSFRDSLVTPADHYTLLENLEPQPKVMMETLILKIQQKMKDWERQHF